MERTECLVFSNGLIDIFIFKPTIPMSDKDCIDGVIKILNDEKDNIAEKLKYERDKASKEIEEMLEYDK